MTLTRMFVFGIALCGLAACETTSENAAYWREADSRCRYMPDPDTRKQCMNAEIELLKQRDDRLAERQDAERERLQRRQEEALARGTPQDK